MASGIPDWLRFRRWLSRMSLLGMAIAAGLGAVLLQFRVGSGLQSASYDWLFNLRRTLPMTNAFVVYLDEESHSELKQPLNAAWDRALHARLIDRLSKAGARAIVFDIVFLDHGKEETPSDRALIEAAKASGRVVLGANPRPVEGQAEPGADPPFDALRDAVEDRWGLVEMIPDPDQVVRRMPPSYPPFKHSLAWATAAFLGAPITQTTNDSGAADFEKDPRWINYYGPANAMAHCSYVNALDPARVPDAVFKDRVVFVGASTLTHFSGERKDSYLTPFSGFANQQDRQSVFISGVEIQATAAMNLLRGEWLTRTTARQEWVVTLGFGAVCGLVFAMAGARSAAFVFLLLEVAAIAIPVGLFRSQRLWTPWLVWVLQPAAAFVFSITATTLRLYVQNQLLEQTVASYVGRKLARKYMREQRRDFLKPGAKKQELTIFFSDIAGFTSISEGMDSTDLAQHMNQYFEAAVGQCIQATDGTVVKYIGDAIFAFWNAPDEQTDHAERACEAALLFRDQPRRDMNGHPLVTRIGLHTGVANVGNFGSTERVDYTALGENINLASRMEGLNKYLGTLTLISGETYRRVDRRYRARSLGRFVLKGFERYVEVYELTGRVGDPDLNEGRDAVFARALAQFQAGRFEAAIGEFRAVLKLTPDDGPSLFFLRKAEGFQQMPPGVLWEGEVELDEK